jgi:hypothetical protein
MGSSKEFIALTEKQKNEIRQKDNENFVRAMYMLSKLGLDKPEQGPVKKLVPINKK